MVSTTWERNSHSAAMKKYDGVRAEYDMQRHTLDIITPEGSFSICSSRYLLFVAYVDAENPLPESRTSFQTLTSVEGYRLPQTNTLIQTIDIHVLSKQAGYLRLLMLFFLAFNCFSFVAAAPTNSEVAGSPEALEKRGLTTAPDTYFLYKRSAGLFWGPHEVGNLKLYIVNPEYGYCGPRFPNAPHINVHVDKKAPRNSWKPVLNLHVVKYTRQRKQCLYAWDSVHDKIVFDNCFDNFGDAIKGAVGAAKDVVERLLENANWIAKIIILAALAAALAAILTSLGAVAVA